MPSLSIDLLAAKKLCITSDAWYRLRRALFDEWPVCSTNDYRYLPFAFQYRLPALPVLCFAYCIDSIRRYGWSRRGPDAVTAQQVLRFAYALGAKSQSVTVQRIRSGWIVDYIPWRSEDPIPSVYFVSRRTGSVFQGFYDDTYMIGSGRNPDAEYRELIYLFDQRMARSPRDLRGGPKEWCLIVKGDRKRFESVEAVRYSVKRVLDIPYTYFRPTEVRIPGLWLAEKLRHENIDCQVARVPKRSVAGLDTFAPSALSAVYPNIAGKVAQPRLPYLVRIGSLRIGNE